MLSTAGKPGARPLYCTLACIPPTHTCTGSGSCALGGGWLSGVLMGPRPVPQMISIWPGLAGLDAALIGSSVAEL